MRLPRQLDWCTWHFTRTGGHDCKGHSRLHVNRHLRPYRGTLEKGEVFSWSESALCLKMQAMNWRRRCLWRISGSTRPCGGIIRRCIPAFFTLALPCWALGFSPSASWRAFCVRLPSVRWRRVPVRGGGVGLVLARGGGRESPHGLRWAHLFSLTPALSRWEREAARRLLVLLGRTWNPQRGRRFSLSLSPVAAEVRRRMQLRSNSSASSPRRLPGGVRVPAGRVRGSLRLASLPRSWPSCSACPP